MISRICRKTQRQIFLLVSGGHICAPQRNTNMVSDGVSTQSVLAEYLANEISRRLDSCWGFYYIQLLSFSRFWPFCMEWLHFYLQWRDSEYREYWFPIMAAEQLSNLWTTRCLWMVYIVYIKRFTSKWACSYIVLKLPLFLCSFSLS